MKEEFITQMISDFESLFQVPRECYDLVVPKLNLVVRKKGETIKLAGGVDGFSRYLCRGFVGYYVPTRRGRSLAAIFQPSDTVFDLDSYRSGEPTPNELKAMSQVVYLELSLDSEWELIARDPHLMQLALLINQRIIIRLSRIYEISKMGLLDGRAYLLREFSGLASTMTNRDLASFFDVSLRTLERKKSNLD